MKQQWKRVLAIMIHHNRQEGYVDEVNGELLFFDSDPCINGIHACYVTIEDVKKYSSV